LGGLVVLRAMVAGVWGAIVGRWVVGPITIPIVWVVTGRLPQTRIRVVDAAAEK